jgi:predicted acetyltransferase
MAGEPTAYRIVPVTPEVAEDFLAVDQAAFFFELSRPWQEALGSLDLSRCWAATPTGEPPFAGIYGSFDMTVTVPAPTGGLHAVPMAGLTWVGVHPDQRRRGVLSQMVRHHFADLHDQGVALSGLHASEPTIYGRFGYAVASLEAVLRLSRGHRLQAPPSTGSAADRVTTRMVALAREGVAEQVHALHARLNETQLGGVVMPLQMARHVARDVPELRRGEEARQVLFADCDGQPVGFAVFHRNEKWEHGQPQGTLTCHEVVAEDSTALLALARRLVDFDLTSSVRMRFGSLDDPVLWWGGGPRAVGTTVHDSLWLRLVDVGAALAQRGLAGPVDVVLDVVDPVCPWNQGRWRLSCAGAGEPTTCERTEDPADVRLPVQALASAYAGLRTIGAQAVQGMVEEVTPGGVGELSAALVTDRQPVAAIPF